MNPPEPSPSGSRAIYGSNLEGQVFPPRAKIAKNRVGVAADRCEKQNAPVPTIAAMFRAAPLALALLTAPVAEAQSATIERSGSTFHHAVCGPVVGLAA